LAKEDLPVDGCVRGVTMDVDLVYSYLIDSTWFFLGSWVVLLLTAGIVAFAPTGRRTTHR